MAVTARPISTISYNSEDFLKARLDAFLRARKIADYRFIFHHGEDGDKDHFHVWVQPNSNRFDAVAFRDEFTEADLTSDKPLGCMPFRASDVPNWLLYVLHDPVYLVAHDSQTDDGKIEYPLTDVITPFWEQLERDFKQAMRTTQLTKEQRAYTEMLNGSSLRDIGLKFGFRTASDLLNIARNNNVRLDADGFITYSEKRIPRYDESPFEELDRGLQDVENSVSKTLSEVTKK